MKYTLSQSGWKWVQTLTIAILLTSTLHFLLQIVEHYNADTQENNLSELSSFFFLLLVR
jgi:hypothetical protein